MMVDRLPYPDEKDHPDPRGELDQQLEVREWQVADLRPRQAEDVPEGAPSWWHGEEEASQSFLREMGVDPARLSGGT